MGEPVKTAIIITGHMRSFDRTMDSLHEHVFSKFPGADFFVSTVKDEDAHKADLLRPRYPEARVEIEIVQEQPDCIADLRAKGCQLPEVWTHGKPYMREKYRISVHPAAVARQLWQLARGWDLFRATSKSEDYGTIIRCRPDMLFHSADLARALNPSELDAWTPGWGRFDGVNDRFAILGRAAASAYFTTYDQIPMHLATGENLHPETLVEASLYAAGCVIRDTLWPLFSTLRASGEIRPPEIFSADLLRMAHR